jgi:ATP-dependent Lhr-like helicase
MELTDAQISRMMKHTWSSFFQRFRKLTPIQRLAIPEVLSGENVFAVAPTATGKTEAIVAPLIELVKENRWEPTSVLYISPTRALVNDARKRLIWSMESLGLTIARRTSDHHEFTEDSDADLVITTPESMDSILMRLPHKLPNIRSVILDEIHLLDNTIRGDQLRFCLERLRRICKSEGGEDIQILGLSATLDDPFEVASRYAPHPEIVQDTGRRDIEMEFISLQDGEWPIHLYNMLVEMGVKKALVFCNKKKDCEEIAKSLNLGIYRGKVLVHHGDLPKSVREHVEEVMNLEGNVAVCVATTTLEVGIDIGDIDVVVLLHPPFSISSFLQRIGRGCRRRNNLTRVICLTSSRIDEFILETMKEDSELGKGDRGDYHLRFSVIVQQMLSYMMQHRDCKRDMKSALSLCELFVNESTASEVLETMQEEDLLRICGQNLMKGEKTPRLSSPMLNINISGSLFSDGTTVRDAATGKAVGWLGGKIEVGTTFRLGGVSWKAVAWEKYDLLARRMAGDSGLVVRPRSRGKLSFSESLANSIKKRLFDAGPREVLIRREGQSTTIFHGLGSLAGMAMAHSLMKSGVSIEVWNELFGVVTSSIPDNWNKLDSEDMLDMIRSNRNDLEKMLSMGRYFRKLGVELRIENVAGLMNTNRLRETILDIRLIEMSTSHYASFREIVLNQTLW